MLAHSNNALAMQPLAASDSLENLLSQHEYSLLFFSASWCGPCQSMTPIVTDVASMMSERFNTIKLDVDNSPHYAAEFGIRGVPTLILVKNGEIIDQRVGGLPKPQLTEWLAQLT